MSMSLLLRGLVARSLLVAVSKFMEHFRKE